MAVVVVGGHTRNIGKTSVVAGLIAALPEMHWTAVKITQYGHGVCSANGEPCDCETDEHTVAVTEERHRDTGTDSSRYLTAGAVRSFWVRTRQGQLAEAMPRLRKEIAAAQERGQNVILESNSVLRFLRPDLFISVLDPETADFKPSALHYLDRADAVVVPSGWQDGAAWQNVSLKLIAKTPRFTMQPPEYCSPALATFVRDHLNAERLRRSGAIVEALTN
jgi:molybdopterin-guanine dinucleotide biosynthesis protein